MKKKLVSLISIIACLALVTGCGEEESSVPTSGNEANSGNNYGDVSGNTNNSDGNNSSDNNGNHDEPSSELDQIISDFVSDINIDVPLTEQFELDEYDVLYYYAYEQYLIYASGVDKEGTIEEQYAALFTEDTNLVNLNDETYTVEDYGYYFGDSDQNVIINFYSEEGYFYLTIYRYDGLAGSLDVSKVDTNWYVDYINFDGYTLVDVFPGDLIVDYLGVEAQVVVPDLTSDPFPAAFIEAYEDDSYGNVPDTYVVILEGDQISSVVDILKKAGFTAEIEENEDYTIDWDLGELVPYTYETGTAYDADCNIYISMQLDESGNTAISFNKFSDLYTGEKTSNTDWTDADKALMNEKLHQLLPFMQFGADYELVEASDNNWTLLVLMDTYAEDLTSDYIKLLLDDGFFIDNTTYEDTYYCYDNGYVYIEIYIEYDGGNYLEIYYEDSHLEPLTSFSLDQTSLDIVAGASYQLTPIYNPSSAKQPTTWSSSNEDVATVSDKGLVTISSSASANSSTVITATTITGKTASCTFVVKANEVTGIAFKEDNYNVVPGAEPFVPEYYFLPYGATGSQDVTFAINPDNAGISYDNAGKLSASNTAVVGATATITVTCGSVSDTATATVIPATITHTLTRNFFGIKEGYSTYDTYKKTTSDGATYEAQAAGQAGIQIRSKNSNSGVIGHFEGRSCKSITFTFDASTEVPNKERKVDIYASNSPFSITDMYGNSVTKVGTITFDKNNLTQTYTFTDNYSYIGFRSADGAVYLPSIQIVW